MPENWRHNDDARKQTVSRAAGLRSRFGTRLETGRGFKDHGY